MITGFVEYKSSQIAWYRFGNGSEPVVCFHGYGEEAQRFAFMQAGSDDNFTFLAIDLPFHGKTTWNEGLHFTARDLQLLVRQVLLENGFTGNFSVIGYSLGGRVALSLYETLPQSVKKMVLLAPDGLKMNFWYWLSTQTSPGRRLFFFTMKNPAWFFGLLKLLNRLRLVNSSIFKFVKHAIGDREIRQLLYLRWTGLRKLKPRLNRIRKQISATGTEVKLLYGQHDRIIRPEPGERFRRGVEDQVNLVLLPAGHQLLQQKYHTEIRAALLP